ncbi:unannotated protein [freshwater metagenome]|uniref:Unannotated protein n=1 Tax=freshwater metagenome TaxID=449393 RepID=A0A6J6F9X9_9ZZZZ
MTNSWSSENLLCLPFELWLGDSNGQDGRKSRQNVIFFKFVVSRLESSRILFNLGTENFHDCLFKAGDVRSTLGRRNDVDERFLHGVVPGAPSKRDVHVTCSFDFRRHHVPRVIQHWNRFGERTVPGQTPHRRQCVVRCKELSELADAAGERELVLLGGFGTIIQHRER